MGKYIVIDIGGSGARIGEVTEFGVAAVQREFINSKEELIQVIKSRFSHIDGIAVSVTGLVHAGTGCVINSDSASYLEGNLKETLCKAFPDSRIYVVNDGEAHALALLNIPHVKLGAINLAIGTSIVLGVLNERGEPVRTVSGENWEIGHLLLTTRMSNPVAKLTFKPYVYWALGENGIEKLKQSMGEKSYKHFGFLLGAFSTQLAILFRPKTIGFSGGYISRYWHKIEESFNKEFRPSASFMTTPEIIAQKDTESALIGLSLLFKL